MGNGILEIELTQTLQKDERCSRYPRCLRTYYIETVDGCGGKDSKMSQVCAAEKLLSHPNSGLSKTCSWVAAEKKKFGYLVKGAKRVREGL
jgi:hypothetical protein